MPRMPWTTINASSQSCTEAGNRSAASVLVRDGTALGTTAIELRVSAAPLIEGFEVGAGSADGSALGGGASDLREAFRFSTRSMKLAVASPNFTGPTRSLSRR